MEEEEDGLWLKGDGAKMTARKGPPLYEPWVSFQWRFDNGTFVADGKLGLASCSAYPAHCPQSPATRSRVDPRRVINHENELNRVRH